MDNYLLKSIPPQSASIYKLLEGKGAHSAKDIGKLLNIFPNAVYRAVRQLLELGFIEEVHEYPVKFLARPTDEAISLYSSTIRQNFQEIFGKGKLNPKPHSLLQLIFIQTRKELIKYTLKDIAKTKAAINLIASGLELPAELILAYKLAVQRCVQVRIIVQNLNEVRKEMLHNWQKNGIKVKYYPNIEARIFVFDHRIVYFTSYDPKNIHEAIGTRFDYAPYAVMMDELFEQRWKMGKNISGVLS